MRLIIIVPPAALSMANGPPLAAPLLRHFFVSAGVNAEIFDANNRFLRLLTFPDISRQVAIELDQQINILLSEDHLGLDQLARLGRLITFSVYEQRRLKSNSLSRSGTEWAAISDMILDNSGSSNSLSRQICERAYEQIVDEVLELSPDHVAFTSLFHIQFAHLVSISRVLRRRGFNGTISIGGAATKLSNDRILRKLLLEASADLILPQNVHSEPLALLGFMNNRRADEVPGAVWLSPDGSLRRNQRPNERVRKLVGPLNYGTASPKQYFEERIFPVLVSEGCYWGRCDFCDYPYLAEIEGSRAVFRSAADVVRDIDTISDLGVSRVDLISDAIPVGYFRKLRDAGGQRLAARGIGLECSIRAERNATNQHFEAMAACGIDRITIGVEALSDDVLAGMDKGNTFEDILRSILIAKSYGIRVKANLIVDHPRILRRHVSEMIERLAVLRPHLESLGLHSFSLSPFAPINAQLEEIGLEAGSNQQSSDHGDHTLQFRRVESDPELEVAIERYRDAAQRMAFALDLSYGRVPQDATLVTLPFRWTGQRAVRDNNSDRIVVRVPARDAPFDFLISEPAWNSDHTPP